MSGKDIGKRDLVLEIGSEEIPSRFVPAMLETLKNLAVADLNQLRIPFKEALVCATPRRLALFVREMSELQEDLVATFRGPAWSSAFDALGNATRAAAGFAGSKGVSVDDLKEVEADGVRYVAAEVREAGRPTSSLLPALLPALIGKLVFPKNMYWADPAVRFARPIRWIVALFGDEVVPFAYGGVTSGRVSGGHRFMGKKHVEIPSACEFMNRLYDNAVILDQNKRRQTLLAGIASLEHEIDGVVELDPELVEENLYLVENPVPFIGSFDERFLEIPQEVLTTSMKKNQKYFAVRAKEGRLKNVFVGVANNRAADMKVIREGNERVLRSRLEDAAFFWEEDRKHPLAGRVERLKSIVYQEKLGTVHDKVMATQKLALWLCESLKMPDISKPVERAALLAKADLVTHMVYEFPELQGVMGREYARLDGEDPRVALALYEQYLPRSSSESDSDNMPTDDVGAILGLAERLYIIVSGYKAGLEPTGTQDPYALRRAARCVSEILWARKLDADVEAAVKAAALQNSVPGETVEKILSFIEQRLLIQLKEKGFEHELAKLAISVTGSRPLQVLRLMEALTEVKDEEWFAALATAAVRVRNILQKAGELRAGRSEKGEFKEGEPAAGVNIDPALMLKDAEKTLCEAIEKMEPLVAEALRENDWKGLTASLSELSPAITGFFKDVMVMDPDERVRANRLAVLRRANALFEEVGNLGTLKLEPKAQE
ncbi:MAG: glycine--tRNA ligase subunit beta [Synergistaceae bacterium]|jgi:glycyl-tRNA synthetase beta chain|nr:glycine--tRNA ligase subunit beta [Synergistaceae bacterium]